MSGEEPKTGSPGDGTTKPAPTLLPKDPNLGRRIGRFHITSVIA